jgi:hypothetical protein
MKIYLVGTAPRIFSIGTDGGKRPASRWGRLSLEITPGAQWMGGWVGSKASTEAAAKRKSLALLNEIAASQRITCTLLLTAIFIYFECLT